MEPFKTRSQKVDIKNRLSSLQNELEPLMNRRTGSAASVAEFVQKKIRGGNLSIEELEALKNLADSDVVSAFDKPEPLKPREMLTTGNLPVDSEPVETPAIRKTFDESLNKFDTVRVGMKRADETEKIKTLINLRNLAKPETQDLIAGKEQLSLREAVAKDVAKERIMTKALESNQYDVFKKALPVTRNAEGEVTIKMTPTVSKLFETPKGKEALLKAQRDFISEEQAGASVRDQLEQEIEKAEREGKSTGGGSGTFLDMFTRATAPKTPQKKTVDVPETGEELNVGAQPPQVPIFADEAEAEASGYKGRAVIGNRLAEIE